MVLLYLLCVGLGFGWILALASPNVELDLGVFKVIALTTLSYVLLMFGFWGLFV